MTTNFKFQVWLLATQTYRTADDVVGFFYSTSLAVLADLIWIMNSLETTIDHRLLTIFMKYKHRTPQLRPTSGWNLAGIGLTLVNTRPAQGASAVWRILTVTRLRLRVTNTAENIWRQRWNVGDVNVLMLVQITIKIFVSTSVNCEIIWLTVLWYWLSVFVSSDRTVDNESMTDALR